MEALVDAALEGYSVTVFAYGQVRIGVAGSPGRIKRRIYADGGMHWQLQTGMEGYIGRIGASMRDGWAHWTDWVLQTGMEGSRLLKRGCRDSLAAYEGHMGCPGRVRTCQLLQGGDRGRHCLQPGRVFCAQIQRNVPFCVCSLQTGSGKTHSIVGPRVGHHLPGDTEEISTLDDADGLLNRAFRYAFDTIAASEDSEYETAVTCAELYNDQVL